jgi:Raf kinase inhibitor-like YbhB/YbcL family protein
VRRLAVAEVLLLTLATTSCGAGTSKGSTTQVEAPRTITVTSPAFTNGGRIPTRYTCDGGSTSPEVRWRGVPQSAKALALVVDDPDASNGPFVHWILLDLARGTTRVAAASVPPGAVQARNGAGDASYTGPCPPSGTHHYRFTVYALGARTGLDNGASTGTALRAVRRLATAEGRLVGTYSRSP